MSFERKPPSRDLDDPDVQVDDKSGGGQTDGGKKGSDDDDGFVFD